MADLEMHQTYKTAKNMTHYDWEWVNLDTETENGNQRNEDSKGTGRIPVQVPVQYIKFVSPAGICSYMPMSELLSRGLGGLTFATATQAITIERGSR